MPPVATPSPAQPNPPHPTSGCPTDLAIEIAAQDLARYARICQENGLVPIVEPEILIDGTHDIATTARVQERLLSTVYKKLRENGVLLEGSLLKPSMTVPGVGCSDKSDPATIAKMTVQVRVCERSGGEGGGVR